MSANITQTVEQRLMSANNRYGAKPDQAGVV